MRMESNTGRVRDGWSWRRTLVLAVIALVLVVPASVPKHFGLPPVVEDAHAANCRLITIYGKEKSTLGVTQYKVRERVYWCSARRRVTYWSVHLSVTYTAPFWSATDTDSYGYWGSWNGRWHGIRYEYRGKTMEGCISNLGGCLKTKRPWILVGMRADLGMTLDWNTKDLKITRVEI